MKYWLIRYQYRAPHPKKNPSEILQMGISEKFHDFPGAQIVLSEIFIKTYCALFTIFYKCQNPVRITFKTNLKSSPRASIWSSDSFSRFMDQWQAVQSAHDISSCIRKPIYTRSSGGPSSASSADCSSPILLSKKNIMLSILKFLQKVSVFTKPASAHKRHLKMHTLETTFLHYCQWQLLS